MTCHYYNRRCVPSSHLAPICYHSPNCQSSGEWVQPCTEMEQTVQRLPEERRKDRSPSALGTLKLEGASDWMQCAEGWSCTSCELDTQ